MTAQFKVPAKTLRWLTSVAFPSNKKQITTVEVTDSVSFYNTFWDGGSRNVYRAVKLENGTVSSLETGNSPWSAVAEGKTVALEPGIAVVEESVFCGKIMPLRVYLHPSNVTPGFLPIE